MSSTVIVAGGRTPFRRFNGELAGVPATELGGAAIRSALARAGVPAGDVQYVIMGQVLSAGCGQMPARQAAVAGGIPMDVPSLLINKVCLSGLTAIATADQLIRAGEVDVVVAGGMESMSRAPHLLTRSRTGYKYGPTVLLDHLAHDGLEDAYTDVPMGVLAEIPHLPEPIGRAEQDEVALTSHRRAAAAAAAGLFKAEIEPLTVPGRRGELVVDADDGIRPDSTPQTLAALPPAFRPDGTVTAGNASKIYDGAVAVVVMSRAEAERRGLPWLAEIAGHGMVAGPDNSLQDRPARAIRAACARAGVQVSDLDLLEINEAFAAVSIASTRLLGVSDDIVNVNGGAIALGHPVGASGARLVLHLALELQRRGGGLGAAGLCGGGGQGDALVLSVPRRG